MEPRNTQVQCANVLGQTEGNIMTVEKKKRETGKSTARSETPACLEVTYLGTGRARVCLGAGRKGKSKDVIQ